jgi:hypothetical protein
VERAVVYWISMTATDFVRVRTPMRRDRRRMAGALGIPLAVMYLVGFGWAMANAGSDVWGAMIIGPIALLATWPFLRAVRVKDGSALATIAGIALVAKLLGAVVLHAVSENVYGGVADWTLYHEQGRLVAEQLRQRWWPIEVGPYGAIGTGFMFIVAGVVQLVASDSVIGGDLVFSWLGFLGYLCFLRAFRLMYPEDSGRRFALLLFFMPSMLFWPSVIGKDAWMSLSLGLATLGVARMLAHHPRGVWFAVLGIVGATVVRPHVALLFFVAFAPALLLRRSNKQHIFSVAKVIAGIVLVVAAALLIGRVERFFGLEQLDSETAQQVLERTNDQTETGGSSFTATPSLSVVNLPWNVVTVLFRPFPFEADNAQTVLAGLEGILLLFLCLVFHRNWLSVPRRMFREPFLLGCLLYVLIFAAAFGSIANFGILARERVQVLPFVFILLSAPLPRWVSWKLRGRRSTVGLPPG